MTSDYDLAVQDTFRLLIRAVLVAAVTLIVSLATYNAVADPLRELARPLGRSLAGRQHPATIALADAADAVLRAIAEHNRLRGRSDWDVHDKTVDSELHNRLAEVVELQKAVALKLAAMPERTPERIP